MVTVFKYLTKSVIFPFKWGQVGHRMEICTFHTVSMWDAAGNIWLADRANHRIQKFDPHGKFILKFGSKGAGPGQLDNPRHVVVDKQLKYFFVADSSHDRIQKSSYKLYVCNKFWIW